MNPGDPHFDGVCDLTPNPDGRTWTVEQDFSFIQGMGDDLVHIVVHKGEVTDLASVPNLGVLGALIMFGGHIASQLMPSQLAEPAVIIGMLIVFAGLRFKPYGKHTRSAVLHDHLYSYRSMMRPVCDGFFLTAMRADGVDIVTAAVMFVGVRVGGWKPFYRKRLAQLDRQVRSSLKGV